MDNIILFYIIITARKRSLGQGNVFTGMCHSFCPQGRVGFPACITGYMTGGCLPPGGSASSRWGGGGLHPGADPPPPRYMGYYEIWSISGQYASYWNAFLFPESVHHRCLQCVVECVPSHPLVHICLTVHPHTLWYQHTSLVYVTVCTLPPSGTNPPHWCASQCAPPPSGTSTNPPHWCASQCAPFHPVVPVPTSLVCITVCTLPLSGTNQLHWYASQCAPSHPVVLTHLIGVYNSVHHPTLWYKPTSLVCITVCTLPSSGTNPPHWCV